MNVLANDIWIEVISYLPISSFPCLASCSKYFNTLIFQKDIIWQNLHYSKKSLVKCSSSSPVPINFKKLFHLALTKFLVFYKESSKHAGIQFVHNGVEATEYFLSSTFSQADYTEIQYNFNIVELGSEFNRIGVLNADHLHFNISRFHGVGFAFNGRYRLFKPATLHVSSPQDYTVKTGDLVSVNVKMDTALTQEQNEHVVQLIINGTVKYTCKLKVNVKHVLTFLVQMGGKQTSCITVEQVHIVKR